MGEFSLFLAMASIIPNFEYDIFISYRHNDNLDGWVTEFVQNLERELRSTLKDAVTIYFDKNPHDGLLELHHVDKSLAAKLKCLIFIPIISQTYCDMKSFAWQHEFCAFNRLAKEDQFGRDIKLTSGNVTSRILPIKIHDIDIEDKALLESEIGGVLRAIEFIYKEAGVNRPLKSYDNKTDNQNKTDYRNQVNKVANAVKEIITGLLNPVKATAFEKQRLAITTQNNAPQKSIAVLPFVNMSNDPDQEYFSDGITEEILNSLAHLKDLKVAGRTSSFQFKGKHEDLKTIGEKLGVRTVLEGSVRKQGNKVRISAQLINVEDGFHLWSEKYDRAIDDIFVIQDEISSAITEMLKVILSDGNSEVMIKPATDNLDAYTDYLKGRFLWAKRTNEGLLKSIEYFEQAIRIDPNYALAYTGLADSYSLLCAYHILSPQESIAKAQEASLKSMELNSNLAEAYETLGHVELLYHWQWDKAIRNYQRAIQLNHGFATAHQRFALLLTVQSKYQEALLQIQIAVNLEPLSLIINTDLALIYLINGQPELSLKKCNEILRIDPDFPVALFVQGLAWELMGDYEKALIPFRQAFEVTKRNPIAASAMAHALAKCGEKEEALKMVKEIENKAHTQFVSPYCIAVVYAGLEMKEDAFHWLQKAIDIRSVWMIHLHLSHDSRLNVLKGDTRYPTIQQQIRI